MAEFRQIHTRIWKDNWFSDLDTEGKILFIYLFSNERASVSGIYELPLKYIVFETGIPQKRVIDLLAQFEKAKKVYYADGVVWVVNLRKYNETGSDKVQIRLNKDLSTIPDSHILHIYCKYYEIPYPYRIDTSPKKFSDTETETETDTDTETDTETDSVELPASKKKVDIAEVTTELLKSWQTLFPEKPQPRPETYRAKIATRWHSDHFQQNWRTALEKASLSPTCQAEEWFNFEFFIRNDENYQKMLNGWMGWKDHEAYGAPKPNGSAKRLSPSERAAAAFGVRSANGNGK